MKKHRVNHPLPVPQRRQAGKPPKAAFVGMAVIVALAVSTTPSLADRQVHAVPAALFPLAADTAARNRPVEVSLLSGIDAIAWNLENIISAEPGIPVADASVPGSALRTIEHPGPFAGQLVGQNVGTLGVLPGGIQLIHPVFSRHITSPYGWRNNPTGPGTQIHIGQDYAIPCGSPVFATADGTVVQSAWAGHSGMRVTIDHGFSVRTGYSHNSRLIAEVGDTVKQGQLIALSGTTGNSTGCHVHFEVIINGRWNDPRNFLPVIPGQPIPKIDSRRTTVWAEPIRNSEEPGTRRNNGHDIEVELPGPTNGPAKAPAPVTETPRPKPSEEAKPQKKPTPEPSQTPSPTPSPKPGAAPSPPPGPKPPATTKPAPESSPPPRSSEATMPPTSTAPTSTAPTVLPSSEPTESPTAEPTSASSTASTEPTTEPTEPTSASSTASTEPPTEPTESSSDEPTSASSTALTDPPTEESTESSSDEPTSASASALAESPTAKLAESSPLSASTPSIESPVGTSVQGDPRPGPSLKTSAESK